MSNYDSLLQPDHLQHPETRASDGTSDNNMSETKETTKRRCNKNEICEVANECPHAVKHDEDGYCAGRFMSCICNKTAICERVL